MNSKEQSTARLEQAGSWWLRLREADARQEEISEWLSWCQRDPANLDAFEKIERLGVRFDHLDPNVRQAFLQDMLADDAPPAAPATESVPKNHAAELPRRRWPGLALAAALATTAVAVGFFVQRDASPVAQTLVYATAKAEARDVRLSDGSQIAIGADTRLDVAYTAALRKLSLGDGEAYFEVAHNPQRPFVVHVGGLRVTAVGTAFNIRKTGGRVEVFVTSGVVDVAGENGAADSLGPAPHLPGSGVIRVPAGQLVVSENEKLTVTPAETGLATSWRRGSQRFVDEDLSVVVANLNRYTRNEVVIADPQLAQLRYTGTVLEGHEREWLAAIEKVFPVTVEHEASGRILLRRRAGRSSSLRAG